MARHPQLSEPAVRLIRSVYEAAKAQGRRPPLTALGRRYGVAKSAISQAANRISYKWVRG